MCISVESLKSRLQAAGVYKSGVARVSPVAEPAVNRFDEWLSQGMNAGMAYMEKYSDIRCDPSLLLPGAVSLISCAFNYYYLIEWSDGSMRWARYALGVDYHEVVRDRLETVAKWITEETGAQCRVCVDTAPLRERYWAVQAGVGFIGLNNQLIIPDAGSHFFLGEILTTLPLPYDSPCVKSCVDCGRCLKACPGKALRGADKAGICCLDARKCLSYLTIEHHGDFPDDTRLGNHIYGCDVCQEVCPHNSNPPVTEIPEFIPRKEILSLTPADISSMTQQDFSRIFSHSAIKRTKLAGLQRNGKQLTIDNFFN